MKRNCRRTDDERDQHDRATRIRKMTDAQICSYIDGLEQKAPAAAAAPRKLRTQSGILLTALPSERTAATASAMRPSEKIRQMAYEMGFPHRGRRRLIWND